MLHTTCQIIDKYHIRVSITMRQDHQWWVVRFYIWIWQKVISSLLQLDLPLHQKKSILFGGNSNVETSMLLLEVGDVFEFVSSKSQDKSRVIYACLAQCNPRSLEGLACYLDTLLSQSHASIGSNVMPKITKYLVFS